MLATWADDPWARGAYSTSPAVALADELAAPIGTLAFAGEHLGGEFAALMEGAVPQRASRRGRPHRRPDAALAWPGWSGPTWAALWPSPTA